MQNTQNMFSFLKDISPEEIVSFIKDESAQMIAIILYFLDTEKSAIVLKGLDDSSKVKVIMNISTMKPVHNELLLKLSNQLEKNLKNLRDDTKSNLGGVKVSNEILSKLEKSTSNNILENISGIDPVMSSQIKNGSLNWKTFINLDSEQRKKVILKLEILETLAKAICSSDKKEINMIMNDVPDQDEFNIFLILHTNKIKEKEIEEAKRRIVKLLSNMVTTNEIEIGEQ